MVSVLDRREDVVDYGQSHPLYVGGQRELVPDRILAIYRPRSLGRHTWERLVNKAGELPGLCVVRRADPAVLAYDIEVPLGSARLHASYEGACAVVERQVAVAHYVIVGAGSLIGFHLAEYPLHIASRQESDRVQ